MHKTLIVLLLSFCINIAFSQFEQFQKKSKVGVNYNGTLISKAKLDSVVFSDPIIATVYKNKSAYYINNTGEKIYKGKIAYLSVFSDGTGIIRNSKRKTSIINRAGNYLMEPTYLFREPIKLNELIFIDNSSINTKFIYGPNGMIEAGFDSVEFKNSWVVTTSVFEEKHKHVEKRFLRKDKVSYSYTTYIKKNIYNSKNSTLIEKGVVKIQDFYGHAMIELENGSHSIYSANNAIVLKNITGINLIDSAYFSGIYQAQKTLFRTTDLEIIVRGDYGTFTLFPNAVHALEGNASGYRAVSIFNYDGKLLRDSIRFVHQLDESRVLYNIPNKGIFIGTQEGDQLSKIYTGFGDAQNGYRIVFTDYSYSYINDSTYAQVPVAFPIIGRLRSTYPAPRRNPIRGIMNAFGNMLRAFTLQKPKYFGSSVNYDRDDINIFESGSGFEDDFAIVCLYGIKENKDYEFLTMVDTYKDLRYNYINNKGEYLNKNEYYECFPFSNGKAWVKGKKYFTLINTQGKRHGKFRFDSVQMDENGYYIVRKSFDYGLLTPTYEQVVPCKYDRLEFLDGNYVERIYGDTTIIYTPKLN